MNKKNIRHILSWIGLIFILLLGQNLINYIFNGTISPNTLLIIIIFFAAYYARPLGIVATFGVGLINDAMQPGVIGISSAAMIVIFFILSLLVKRLYLESKIVLAIVAIILQIVFSLLTYFLNKSFIGQSEIHWYVVLSAGMLGVVTSLSYPLLVKFYLPRGME